MLRIGTRSLLTGAVLLSLGRASDAPLSRVALWPGDADASLAVETVDSSDWTVQTSSGGVLFAQATSAAVPVPRATNVSSIQVSWVPPSPPPSSTFDIVFGAASQAKIPSPFSAGVHVQVALTTADLAQADAALLELFKTAPASVLRLLPKTRSRDGGRTTSILARSLCASTGFKSHLSNDGEACFSASFPWSAEDSLLPLYDWLSLRSPAGDFAPRLFVVSLRPSVELSGLTREALVAGTIPSGRLSRSELTQQTNQIFAAKKIDLKSGFIAMRSVLSSDESTQDLRGVATPFAADVLLSVRGEGFHRRFHVGVSGSLKGQSLCEGDRSPTAKVLLLVPLSTSVYADLDELRRMERFGELTLRSPTKYIEIERPTAVSSQHSIALEFTIDSTSNYSVEFPIHLRYQSPSNTTFYASAILNPPEIFVSCSRDSTRKSTNTKLNQGSLTSIFLRWLSDSAWDANGWQRVAPRSPLKPIATPVPVAFTPHGSFVSVLTLSVTSLGALLLVYIAVWATRDQASVWKTKSQ